MFWIVLVIFVLVSLTLTAIVLMQEPKQSGLGDALSGGGGGGDFGSAGGTAGGLHRMTIYVACIWAALAILLQVVSR
ncbi:MAG TPA: preprotein translocase subunit SecG [Trueperaceae bacterium]|nr:preprotein translocase subunit SecG [Trueperaceae bacterium]